MDRRGRAPPRGAGRCDGFKRAVALGPGRGGGPRPVFAEVAYTAEQVEDLASTRCTRSWPRALWRTTSTSGWSGSSAPAATGRPCRWRAAPDARDGARTTWQHFDETHRLHLAAAGGGPPDDAGEPPEAQDCRPVVAGNDDRFRARGGFGRRADVEFAQAVEDGSQKDSSLFFFHRQASDEHDLTTEDGVRAAVVEASGPAAEWSDIDGICDLWRDPTSDLAYMERVFANRLVQQTAQAFAAQLFVSLEPPGRPDRRRRPRGRRLRRSRFHDDTGLVVTEIETGLQEVVGLRATPAESTPAGRCPDTRCRPQSRRCSSGLLSEAFLLRPGLVGVGGRGLGGAVAAAGGRMAHAPAAPDG